MIEMVLFFSGFALYIMGGNVVEHEGSNTAENVVFGVVTLVFLVSMVLCWLDTRAKQKKP